MAHDPHALQATLSAASPPDLPLAFRAMFGGIMVYAEGKPFAILAGAGLALKCASGTHAALLGLPCAARLRFALDKPESRTYVVVPESMLTELPALRVWIRRCAGELTAAPKKTGRTQR